LKQKSPTLSGAGSGSKKSQECGNGSKLGSMTLQEELKAEAKNILLLPHPCLKTMSQMPRFIAWQL